MPPSVAVPRRGPRSGRGWIPPLLRAAVAVPVAAAILLGAGCARGGGVRPAQDGRVVLRLWDYRWPAAPDGTDYEAWLRRQVHAFVSAHRGVEVEVHLLDLEGGPAAVHRALAEGRVPDVLGTRPGDPVLLSPRWQVPAGSRLRGRERDRYLPPSLGLASAGGRLWVWPWWFAADAWLAREESLPNRGPAYRRAVIEGWDWIESSSLLAPAGGRGPVVVVPGAGSSFLRPLLAWHRGPAPGLLDRLRRWLGRGGGAGADDRAGLALSVESLRAAADWVEGLRSRGVLARPGRLGDRGHGGLAAFLAGRAPVLAGANPWLVSLIMKREAERGRASGLALLPVPEAPRAAGAPPVRALGGRAPIEAAGGPLRLAALAVFRPPDSRGPRQLEAAMELARFLSRRVHPWAAGAGPIFPAEREAWLRWAAAAGEDSSVFAAFTLHRARGLGEGLDLSSWSQVDRAWALLRPALDAFWEGRSDAASLLRVPGLLPPPRP